MPTMNAFKVVTHEKNIFKGVCYINLYTRYNMNYFTLGRGYLLLQGIY